MLDSRKQSNMPLVKIQKPLVNPIGFTSPTTNTFQLGLKGPGQWVGEDFLCMKLQDETATYTAVATNQVLCYQLKRSELD